MADDLHGPRMVRDFALIPKDILKDELNMIDSMRAKFDDVIDFSKEGINKWLVIFVTVNEDQSIVVA